MSMSFKSRIVPWLSIKEWQRTQEHVFSENLDDKHKGLEELIVWKSRVPILPVGIECTLHLLQVILQDINDKSNYWGSNDIGIQLMYSTSIIRFVNLVSHIGQNIKTHRAISDIAQQILISDWLVNVRHEATHGKLPTLEVLRSGARVAMDWLEENYWQVEAENSFDMFWPETRQGFAGKKSESSDHVTGSHHQQFVYDDTTIPEYVLSATKMLIIFLKEMPGRQALHQVKNEAVKQYAYKLWSRSKTNSDTPNEEKSMKHYQPLKIIRRLLVSEFEKAISEWTTKEDPTLLTHSSITIGKGERLAFLLYSCRELIADLDPESHHQKPLWKLLDEWNVAPFLIHFLSLPDKENASQHAYAMSLISSLADHLLNQPQEGGNFDFIPTIRNLLLKPDPETLRILPKLEKLQASSLPNQSAWYEMQELLKIRLGREAINETVTLDHRNQSQKYPHIFTLGMIKEDNEIASKQVETLKPVSIQLNENSSSLGDIHTWTLSSSDCDWSRTPIGALANSTAGHITLNMSCLWESLNEKSEGDISSRSNSQKRSVDRFDWDSLVRKRRRRGGLKASTCSLPNFNNGFL